MDPTDETEFQAAMPDQLKEWYDHYRELTHGDPLVDKDPSPDHTWRTSASISLCLPSYNW